MPSQPVAAGAAMAPLGGEDPLRSHRVSVTVTLDERPLTHPSVAVPRARSGYADTAADRSSMFEVLTAVVPAIGGAALAIHLAGQQNGDPLAWAALGGAVGMMVGWACLLFIRRGD